MSNLLLCRGSSILLKAVVMIKVVLDGSIIAEIPVFYEFNSIEVRENRDTLTNDYNIVDSTFPEQLQPDNIKI